MTAPTVSRWSWTPRNVAALIVLAAVAAVWIGWRMAGRGARMGADLVVTGAETPPAAEKIDPNTATWASLARLPGIGPGRAKEICRYREQFGGGAPFEGPDDLQNVRGIGPTLVEGIRPYLTFGEPAGNETAGGEARDSRP